jgi:hypothetical protein
LNQYELQNGLFDRKRILIIAPDYVEFENGNLKGKEFTRFNKDEIVDIKHDMDWIVWYEFTVGRKFTITFKNKFNKELKVVFKSYFSLKRQYNQPYADIVNDIWNYYLTDIANLYLDKYYNNEELFLQGLKISPSGVTFADGSITLGWDELSYKEYFGYFAVYKTINPEINSRIDFNKWHSEILFCLIRTIVSDRVPSPQTHD